MHDLLFSRQDTLDVEAFEGFAAELELDAQQFNQCLESNEYADEIQGDIADALEY